MISGPPFESGKIAGQRLRQLFVDLGYELEFGEPPLERIESILSKTWSRSSVDSPNPVFIGFLSQFLREESCSTDILNIWSLDEILTNQSEVAPMCNLPESSGLFAFADWTGESDGDCWCFDTVYQCIRCIPVGSGYEDASQSRLESYGVFPEFNHFASYLRCEAELREWIGG